MFDNFHREKVSEKARTMIMPLVFVVLDISVNVDANERVPFARTVSDIKAPNKFVFENSFTD